MKQRNETSIRHVQTRLTSDEYDKLERYSKHHGISLNLAIRGIIVDAIENKANLLPEGVMTTKERAIVRRMLIVFRSGNNVAIKGLLAVMDCLERVLLRASQ